MFQRRILPVSISLVAIVAVHRPGTPRHLRRLAPPRSSLTGRSKDSALTGTQQIGQAKWRAENGEIVGTPASADGGWLLINPGYQDVQVAGSFRCAAACTAGVMVRSEKSAAGIKGIYTTLGRRIGRRLPL